MIDDNRDHAKILQWAFRKSGRADEFTYFEDGRNALDYLKTLTADQKAVPDFIFLDLNLPRLDGREVLRLLKEGESTKPIPVIIVSSSEREEDVRRAYELGASSYVSKTAILNDIDPMLKTIQEYWSKAARSQTK
ncbi:MAG: response regulator [Ignavibacteriales bacterium]|nr:response regulator [Ignavibacteriales bacterium]